MRGSGGWVGSGHAWTGKGVGRDRRAKEERDRRREDSEREKVTFTNPSQNEIRWTHGTEQQHRNVSSENI